MFSFGLSNIYSFCQEEIYSSHMNQMIIFRQVFWELICKSWSQQEVLKYLQEEEENSAKSSLHAVLPSANVLFSLTDYRKIKLAMIRRHKNTIIYLFIFKKEIKSP